MATTEAAKREFSEQDTADKLMLPYLASQHHFRAPNSLDYQAQHTLPTSQHMPVDTMASVCRDAIP